MKTKVVYLTSKIMVAIVLIAILAAKAYAGEAPKVKLVPHSNERAIVVVDNTLNSYAELTIEDAKGDVLYYREGKINEKSYSKIFDFKNLSDGNYKITVKNNLGKSELNFELSNNKVVVEKDVLATAPFFYVENEVLKISYLNQSQNDIRFTLSNYEGELYKKSLGDNFSITTGFKLSNLSKGEYAASINDGVRTYSYTFEK